MYHQGEGNLPYKNEIMGKRYYRCDFIDSKYSTLREMKAAIAMWCKGRSFPYTMNGKIQLCSEAYGFTNVDKVIRLAIDSDGDVYYFKD